MYAKREVFLMATVANRLADKIGNDRAALRILYDWLDEHDLSLRFDAFELEDVMASTSPRSRRLNRAQRSALLDAIKDWRARYETVSPAPIERNAAVLSKSLGLDKKETALFQAVLVCGALEAFNDLQREMADVAEIRQADLLALLLERPKEEIVRALEKGPLVEAGLLSSAEDEDGSYVPWGLRQALSGPERPVADIERRLIGAVAKPETTAEDHEHYASDRDFVGSLLKGAMADRAEGVNILVYGPTGTGKTEFCRMIAKELDAALYGVGEADEDDKEPARDDRISSLLLAQKLVARRKDALILFDEMDDLLEDGGGGSMGFFGEMPVARTGSKVFLHRMLEGNKVPTLSTTNEINHVDDALLRRMTYTLQMLLPPVQVRARIWQRIGAKQKFKVTAAQADELARTYEVSPAVAANAMRAAKLTRGGYEALKKALDGNRRAVYGEQRGEPAAARDPFEPSLLNTDLDLKKLADRLTAKDSAKDFSLLLTGPPGTGKTAYVRYLAKRMGMDVMQKRASDLVSMWVGQTEQQIAEAFKEAADTGRFLVFDEADSMLYDRRNATRSFEVSQVNEMLTWMEAHPLPFACTSNLKEGIDQAAMRRFTFKVMYDYMKLPQVKRAFRTFFDVEAPARVRELDVLTPGDFAVVKKKLKFMGNDISPDELVGFLEKECEAKADWKPAGNMGFRK